MKKLFLVLGICILLVVLSFAIPSAGEKRINILNRIDSKTALAKELIYTYVKGTIEIDGIKINLTQEQKNSLKAEYNEIIHYLQDSIPYITFLM